MNRFNDYVLTILLLVLMFIGIAYVYYLDSNQYEHTESSCSGVSNCSLIIPNCSAEIEQFIDDSPILNDYAVRYYDGRE